MWTDPACAAPLGWTVSGVAEWPPTLDFGQKTPFIPLNPLDFDVFGPLLACVFVCVCACVRVRVLVLVVYRLQLVATQVGWLGALGEGGGGGAPSTPVFTLKGGLSRQTPCGGLSMRDAVGRTEKRAPIILELCANFWEL